MISWRRWIQGVVRGNTYHMQTFKLRMILVVDVLLGISQTFAQTTTTLPVYQVAQTGLNDSQTKALYASLKIPAAKAVHKNGMVSFVDPIDYLAIPSKPVTDAGVLKQLLASTKNEGPGSPIRVDAIDFDALRKRTVLDSGPALKFAAAGFASAGVQLGSAKPTVSHTVFAASYKDANGAMISVNQMLDTRVNYHFFDANGHEFTGPGAQVEMTFDSAAKVTHLQYAWREVKAGPMVNILSESQARDRIAKLLPANATINLRLVYWCPPFESVSSKPGQNETSPTSIIPWYSFTGTREIKDSTGRVSNVTSKERLIPATDDPRYIPSARLKVSGAGQRQIEASVEVSGGRAPYTYTWTGSNPALLTNSGATISYVPLVRTMPPGSTFAPSETRPARESVSVTVTDANGIATQASQVVAVLAQPIAPDTSGVSHGGASYGCESPGEPEEWTQERVGWQQGMANPGGGSQQFCWLGDTSWPGDYIKPTPAGSLPATPWIYGDADYSNWGVNTANLVLINGDGWPDGFTAMFPGAPQSDYNNLVDLWRPGNPGWTVQMPTAYYNVNYNGSWGPVGANDRLYWLAGLLCECLDEKDAAGLTNDKRWLSAFGGLHIFTGFASNAAYSAGAFPRAFGENILGVSGSPETILNAWFDASTSTSEGTAAAMGPMTTGGVTDMNDHYIGKGSIGPTILPANVTGWWYLHQ
jgi:hypothetical protein